ncbi:dipeptidase [Paenibacillus assamensis]|uniref:dipeptidase n=1 Tax=Paenibacillus assamensis TaxID=311244 RepID=UPI000413E36B|nr:dipeptidase [Paenibacillus assamensis]
MKHTKIIDFHCDVLYKMLYENKVNFENAELMDITLPRLKKGQVGMQVFALFLEAAPLIGPPRFAQVLRAIDLFREQIAVLPEMHWVKWKEDLEMLEQDRSLIGSILSLEGVDALEGDMVYVRTLFELGVRFIGLSWNHANWAVDGAGEPRSGGFTTEGWQLVDECDRLGIVLDVSHLNERAFWELMDGTTRPVIASHSNCASLQPHPRNLTDDQIRAIIARDGRIGVTYVPLFVAEKELVTIEDLLGHIDHIIQLGGENHLMLGSDFDGIDDKIQNLEHAEHHPNLLAMIEQRYGSAVMNKIAYENANRFLRTYLPQRV